MDGQYSGQKVFKFITRNIFDSDFYDPANNDNIITEDLTLYERKEIRDKTYKSLNRKYWAKIFQNIR